MWDDFFGLAGKSSGNVFSSLDASLLDTCEAPWFSGNVFDDGDRFSKYFQYNAYYDRIPWNGFLATKQIEYIKSLDAKILGELNKEAKWRGDSYLIVTDPKQIEGIQLGYVVKRALNVPPRVRNLMTNDKEYIPIPGSIKTVASHEALFFPWAEGNPNEPGTSILSYSDDNIVAYAGGDPKNENDDFRYRGAIDPKEYYIKENGCGAVTYDIAFDVKKMYETVKNDDMPKSWLASKDKYINPGIKEVVKGPASGHQCRGYVRNAAMEAYMQSGGKIYLIPTEDKGGKPGL